MEISPEKLAASGVAGAILIVLLTPGLCWKVTHFVGVLLGKYVHKTHRVCKSGEPPIEYGDAEFGVSDELWDNPWGYLKKVSCRKKVWLFVVSVMMMLWCLCIPIECELEAHSNCFAPYFCVRAIHSSCVSFPYSTRTSRTARVLALAIVNQRHLYTSTPYHIMK